jgi:3-oxoacyl-(acyl-carrier-protein) synthase/malonyl CoA-acyl carrier protein transacylase/thioesterase domain-containing protein
LISVCSCHKQQRLHAGATVLRVQDFILQQRKRIDAEMQADAKANGGLGTWQARFATAKAKVDQQETLHPANKEWQPAIKAHFAKGLTTKSASTAAQTKDLMVQLKIDGFFSEARKKKNYNVAARRAEIAAAGGDNNVQDKGDLADRVMEEADKEVTVEEAVAAAHQKAEWEAQEGKNEEQVTEKVRYGISRTLNGLPLFELPLLDRRDLPGLHPTFDLSVRIELPAGDRSVERRRCGQKRARDLEVKLGREEEEERDTVRDTSRRSSSRSSESTFIRCEDSMEIDDKEGRSNYCGPLAHPPSPVFPASHSVATSGGSAVSPPAIDENRREQEELERLQEDEASFVANGVVVHNCTGPTMAVQTACSSSLSTIAVAMDHLRLGRCDVALVVASSLRLPGHDNYTYQPGMIFSESGRCRPFEQRADGTVPGSAAVVVVLTRENMLAALGPLTRSYAVLDAVAVGNNGRQPAEPGSSVAKHTTFSTPTMQGQVRVLRQALRQAGILEQAPELVRYVESHGTGTAVGDAVEWSTLHDVFTPSKTTTWVGSAKANIGHTDAASGLVGLVKTALILFHNHIPNQPDFEQMHEALPTSACLRVSSSIDSDRDGRPFEAFGDQPPKYACVQSIGMGGTNTSAVLRRFVAASRDQQQPNSTLCKGTTHSILLRASSLQQAEIMRDRMQQACSEIEPSERAVWSQESWRRELAQRGESSIVLSHALPVKEYRCVLPDHPEVAVLEQGSSSSSVLVMCTGQGSFEWKSLCVELRASDEMSRQMSEHVEYLQQLYAGSPEAFRQEIPSPLEVWQHTKEEALSTALDAWQPCLTASLQLCQWSKWRSHVSEHSASPSNHTATVLGHSLGEYTAACISGALTWQQMLQLLFFRMLCLHRFAHLRTGAMLLVHASSERAAELARQAPECFLACHNSANHTVLCGKREHIEKLEASLNAQPTPIRWKRLDDMTVSYHAPEVYFGTEMKQLWFREWPLLPQAAAAAAPLPLLSSPSLHSARTQGVRFVSCLDKQDDVSIDQLRTPEHWWRHLTSPVYFNRAVASQLDRHTVLTLELGQGRGLGSLARANNNKNTPLRHVEPKTIEHAWLVGMQLHLDALGGRHQAFLHEPAATQLPVGSALSHGCFPHLACDRLLTPAKAAARDNRSAAVVPRLSLGEAIKDVAATVFKLPEQAPWTTELFCELGNDSLQVVTFLHKLDQATCNSIPRHLLRPEHLYAHPSLREFEAWLAPQVQSESSSSSSTSSCWTEFFQVDCSEAVDRNLIVLLPPAGGTLHLLDEVVRNLQAQLASTAVPVSAVRCIGLHRPMQVGVDSTQSIQNLAAYYNRLLQDYLVSPPAQGGVGFNRLTLVGASFGGMVAFEMLQQWSGAAAPSVRHLVMLDTPSKRTFRFPRDDLLFVIWWMLERRFSLPRERLNTILDLEALRAFLMESHSFIRTSEEWETCVEHARIMHEDVISLKSFAIEHARLRDPPPNGFVTCTLIECDRPNAAMDDAVQTAQDWQQAFGSFSAPSSNKAPGSHLSMFTGAGAQVIAAEVLRISRHTTDQ